MNFNEEHAAKVAAFNATADPTKTRVFTQEVLDLADELFSECLTIIEEAPEVKALTPEDRAALFVCLADAFNDTTKD